MRGHLILQAKAIFDYVIDGPKKDDPTLPTIISDCLRFETAWAKCPSAEATARSFSVDKMDLMYTTGSYGEPNKCIELEKKISNAEI